MRPSHRVKTPKAQYKHRINLKKQKRSKSNKWHYKRRYSSSYASSLHLGNINELLHTQKTNQVDSKKSWKVVPKDSCEVYRERRNRRLKSAATDNKEESVKSVEDQNKDQPKRSKRRGRPRQERRTSKKKSYGKGRLKKKQSECSVNSVSSKHQSSNSEMDYDS